MFWAREPARVDCGAWSWPQNVRRDRAVPDPVRRFANGKKAKTKRRYSRSAGTDVKNEMRRYKRGTAKSGKGGKAGKVKSRKQAVAIGLSKARKKGKKVPKKRSKNRS